MRHLFALAVLFSATAFFGCATQQPDQTQAQPAGAPQLDSQLVIAPKVTDVPAHPLPFKGKLLSGDRLSFRPRLRCLFQILRR